MNTIESGLRPTTGTGARLFALLLALAALPAGAHHSYAMFEPDKSKTVDGLVKIWEMTSPHAYLWIYVESAPQKYDLYGFEAPGPQELLREGWNKTTVKPGDKVTVTFAPLKDGRHGGNLQRLVLADGRSLTPRGGMPIKGTELHQ